MSLPEISADPMPGARHTEAVTYGLSLSGDFDQRLSTGGKFESHGQASLQDGTQVRCACIAQRQKNDRRRRPKSQNEFGEIAVLCDQDARGGSGLPKDIGVIRPRQAEIANLYCGLAKLCLDPPGESRRQVIVEPDCHSAAISG